tara:strand:- start:1132 stop:1398 length:267 start_codon:yes stop_codon:yes gene_type:complete
LCTPLDGKDVKIITDIATTSCDQRVASHIGVVVFKIGESGSMVFCDDDIHGRLLYRFGDDVLRVVYTAADDLNVLDVLTFTCQRFKRF